MIGVYDHILSAQPTKGRLWLRICVCVCVCELFAFDQSSSKQG